MAQGLEAPALVMGWLGVPVGYAALAMRVGGSRLEAGFQPWERVTPLAVSFSFMVQLRLTVLELKGAYRSR